MAELALSKIVVVVIVVAVGLVLLGIIAGVLDIGKVLKSVGGDALCAQTGWFCEEEEPEEEVPPEGYIESFGITRIGDVTNRGADCEVLLEWKPIDGSENDIKDASIYWDYTEYLDDFPPKVSTGINTVDCLPLNLITDKKCVFFDLSRKGTGDYRFLLVVKDTEGNILESKEAGPTGAEYVLCDYLRSDTGTGETFQEMILSNADGNLDDDLTEKTGEWFESYVIDHGYGPEYQWRMHIAWTSGNMLQHELWPPYQMVGMYCGVDIEDVSIIIGDENNQILVELMRCMKST